MTNYFLMISRFFLKLGRCRLEQAINGAFDMEKSLQLDRISEAEQLLRVDK